MVELCVAGLFRMSMVKWGQKHLLPIARMHRKTESPACFQGCWESALPILSAASKKELTPMTSMSLRQSMGPHIPCRCPIMSAEGLEKSFLSESCQPLVLMM